MNEFDLEKVQRLLSLTTSEYYGVFVKDNHNGVQTKESVASSVLSWLEKEKTPERVERVINHVHIYDLFLDITQDECDSIAVQIFVKWNETLKKIDPSFRVEKYEDYGPVVTFYKCRET